MNNEYGKPSLFVFEAYDVGGSSPQLEDYYLCKELGKGSENFHLLFPKFDIPRECFIEGLYEVNIPEVKRKSRVRPS